MMMGTRRMYSSSLYAWISSSSSLDTKFGWSQMFIRVPITICVFTVACVCLNHPTPASMSLMIRQVALPRTFMISAACLYLRRINRPGSPAHSSSSSPADITTGCTPSALHASSRLNVLPHPFEPQMPRISGTLVRPSAFSPTPGLVESMSRFLAMCRATLSTNCLGT